MRLKINYIKGNIVPQVVSSIYFSRLGAICPKSASPKQSRLSPLSSHAGRRDWNPGNKLFPPRRLQNYRGQRRRENLLGSSEARTKAAVVLLRPLCLRVLHFQRSVSSTAQRDGRTETRDVTFTPPWLVMNRKIPYLDVWVATGGGQWLDQSYWCGDTMLWKPMWWIFIPAITWNSEEIKTGGTISFVIAIWTA